MRGLPHIWLPYTQMKTTRPPLAVELTRGTRIVLADGRELSTASRAGGRPATATTIRTSSARISAQAANDAACHAGRAGPRTGADAGRNGLCAIAPGGMERVFFSDSGSVAVEVAMKMATQYWLNRNIRGRTKFLAFRGGYHGDTIATMAVCDPDEGMHSLFAGLLPQHHIVDLPRDEESIAAFDAFLERHASEIAGILVEPLVQGAGGMLFHDENVLRRLRAAADKYELLLIFDEIFTGFGRTGAMFACRGGWQSRPTS